MGYLRKFSEFWTTYTFKPDASEETRHFTTWIFAQAAMDQDLNAALSCIDRIRKILDEPQAFSGTYVKKISDVLKEFDLEKKKPG